MNFSYSAKLKRVNHDSGFIEERIYDNGIIKAKATIEPTILYNTDKIYFQDNYIIAKTEREADEKMEKEILSFGAKLEQLLKEGKVKKEDTVRYDAWAKLWHKLCELEDEIKKRRDLESGIIELCARRILKCWFKVLNIGQKGGKLSKTLKEREFCGKWEDAVFALILVYMSGKENLNLNFNEK